MTFLDKAPGFRFLRTAALVALFLTTIASVASAQLTGPKSIPGDYATIAAAITDLNAQGVGAGGVTFNVAAGYTETISATLSVTATGTLADPIVFQKSGAGANPLVTAYTGGTGTPSTATQDGIWRLVGSDYVTIDGIDLAENAANVANPATMEYGYSLYKASATDGCQNITIQNCTITLNRVNNAAGSGPSVDGSKGIQVVNATAAAPTTNLTTTSAAGSNSNNRLYANIIQNCNIGIALIGFADVTPFTFADQNNDVGGAALATGNTIRNFGGGATTSPAAGIRTLAQYGVNLSYNNINNNNGAGVNHATTLRGIFNNTATSASGVISNNTISLKSAATTSILTAIENVAGATAAGNTISINNNTITGCTYTTATSGAFTGITNTAGAATVNINGNTLSSNSTAATSGTTNLIQNTGAATVALNINSNNINGWTYTAATTSGTLNGVITSGTLTAAVSVSSNNFQAITHAVNGATAHIYVSVGNASSATANINSNTFTNLNVATSGSVTFITRSGNLTATGVENCNSNSIVTGFNKGVAGGTVTFYTANASSVNGATMTNTLNNFSNVTVTGATTVAGWSNTEGASASSGPAKTVTQNTFSGITAGTSAVTGLSVNFSGPGTSVSNNTISNISSAGAITGINLGSSNQATLTASQNLIDPIASTGAAAVTGITTAAPTTIISKNKIYDLSGNNAGTTVNGILVTAGTNVTLANNLIGDLRASAASAADPIRAISSTSTTATSTINVYFNSIYLNATSSGANFGTSGVFHTTSATATTAALNLRNNVIVNTSTANGTGVTAAYRRSSTTLTNYAGTSNNNLLYAGAPGASRLLFYDGTNSDQTLAAYKSRVSPRDAASITENPPFLSTTGSSPNFLHIDPGTPTQLESAGQAIAGFPDDFDGDTRNVTTPDIGADEGTFTLADLSGPAISYTPITNSTNLVSLGFTNVTVTDPSGVNGTPGTSPRVYYKKSSDANNTFNDNTNGTVGWKYAESNGATSPFDFTIDYSRLSGGTVSVGDVVQYFVIAQDNAGTPNVGINSGTFTAQPASVALTAAAFPIGGTIRTYTIVDAPLNGDYTVGTLLFNQLTGANITFERQVRTVMRDVLEPVAQAPQMTGDKSSTDVNLSDQVEWKTVRREVEEVIWVPMSNGRKYDGDLYMKRVDNPALPQQAAAGIYATITAAVNDLNLRGVSGPVRFLLTDPSYGAETLPITINVASASVPTAANPVTIKPSSGVTATVSGVGAGSQLFKIINTNYITIDGSNTVGGTTRDLTLENSSATTPNVVWFGSSGTTPITNGTLKNCIVRNGANTSSAVVISDGATAGNPGYFSTMDVRNNLIEKAFIGVYSNGGTTPANGAGLTYADNTLSTAGANAIRLVGLYMQGVTGATISNNTLGNFDQSNDENDIAIWLATGTTNATVFSNTISTLGYTGASAFAPIGINVTSGVAGANINVTRNSVTGISTNGSTSVRGIASLSTTTTGVTIDRNVVQGVANTNTGTFGAYGIDASSGNNHTIKNNFVSDVRFNMSGGAAFSTTFGVFGIRVGSGTGHLVAFNSVNLYGTMPGTANSSLLSAALCVVGTASTGCDIRNNILTNTLTGGTTSIAHVSAYLPSGATSAMNLTWNNNAYYCGATAASQGIAQTGSTAGTGFYLPGNFNPGATSPSSNLRAYTSTLSGAGTNDNASFASTAAAPYTSASDLHIITNALTPVSNTGAPIGGINNDIDGDLRSFTPDIGADEFTIYTLTTAVVGSGSVAVSPSQTAYAPGSNVLLTATPADSCQEFVGWSGDAGGNTNPLNIVMDADKSITATFALKTYTITASAGAGGSISPNGATIVDCVGSQAYTITADPCYMIADVLVDGVSVGAVGSYTFSNVTANHTIAASFVIDTYTITASAGAGGSIAPSGATIVNCDGSQTYLITADPCYMIADVLVDGVSVGAVGSYTFLNVMANHTIVASFAIDTYTITASAGAGGSIAPSGATIVNCDGSQTYTITPDACYHIADVLVDNVSVGAVGSYTFLNVMANHTIVASFAIDTYTITASAGAGGSIAPNGATIVNCDGSQTYTITPDACYQIADVLVDNVSVGAVGSYTFLNVMANHTIAASFVQSTYTITATAGPNGTIVPAGAINVACGDSLNFIITPDAGFAIDDVLVDAVSVGPVGSYTFLNVGANHTIHAMFRDILCPVVTVTAPNGGETLIIGVPANLTWTATDNVGVTCVDLLLSRTGVGGPYTPLATCIANTGTYGWIVTTPQTNTAFLKVVGHDAAGNMCEDVSDASFRIIDFVVPVLLSQFQANAVNDGVELRWAMTEDGMFVRTGIERGDAVTGPFQPIEGTLRVENGQSVLLDRQVTPGQTYYYRIVGLTRSGQSVTFDPLAAIAGLPVTEFALPVISPNPARGVAQINFSVPREARIRLTVLDVQGRVVTTLVDGIYTPGRYLATWSGDSETGPAPSGIYFVRMDGPERKLVQRVVLVH